MKTANSRLVASCEPQQVSSSLQRAWYRRLAAFLAAFGLPGGFRVPFQAGSAFQELKSHYKMQERVSRCRSGSTVVVALNPPHAPSQLAASQGRKPPRQCLCFTKAATVDGYAEARRCGAGVRAGTAGQN